MKVVRTYLTKNETIEYNHRVYDNQSNSWLEYRAVSDSNSNSNDDYVYTSKPSIMDIFAVPKNI